MGCNTSISDSFADIKIKISSRNVASTAVIAVSRKRGLVGLKNLGNTCFMNSALQCLSNTAPLADFFIKPDWSKEINRTNPLGKKGEIADAFGELIRLMWLGGKGGAVVSPTNFKRTLGKHFHSFQGYEQHDAQELLAFLLDGLHEDLNRVVKKPYVEDLISDGTKADEDIARESWERYQLRNRSVIVDLSQGQLKSCLKCLECGSLSIKFEPLMYLSLPILKRKGLSSSISLLDCLDDFCKKERLTGDCRWKCPKCKEFRDAEKSLSIWSLPRILIVHLKRFEYDARGSRSKINTLVNFPLRSLDFSPMSPHEKCKPLYDLYGVSNHHGSLGGGHYTAIAQNRIDKNWYLFNDSSLTQIDEGEVCTKAAYVLFFHRAVTADKDFASTASASLYGSNNSGGDLSATAASAYTSDSAAAPTAVSAKVAPSQRARSLSSSSSSSSSSSFMRPDGADNIVSSAKQTRADSAGGPVKVSVLQQTRSTYDDSIATTSSKSSSGGPQQPKPGTKSSRVRSENHLLPQQTSSRSTRSSSAVRPH